MIQKTKEEILNIEDGNLVIGSNKLTMRTLEVLIDIRNNLDKLNESLNRVGTDIVSTLLNRR